MRLNKNQRAFVEKALEMYGTMLTREQVIEVSMAAGVRPASWLTNNPDFRVSRGLYQIPETALREMQNVPPVAEVIEVDDVPDVAPVVNPEPVQMVGVSEITGGFSDNLVPEKDPLFVPFGPFKQVQKILNSRMFYPFYITGLSGNGKTFSIEQACARAKREVIRINFTIETDEDDLIGGFRLVAGETKFFKGPVIRAMELGAVLLLDEIDLGNPAKIMCLQSILEGKGYFIKKTGEFIKPKEGFTVASTANTKGKGSDDGRFIGTNVLNEAFLERFPVTFEQKYAPPSVENKILDKVFKSLEIDDAEFSKKLVDWADTIRKTFYDDGVDEVISTRRLVHIAKAFSIFEDRMTAIEICINRFDDETKESFRDLYTKLDESTNVEEEDDDTEVEEATTTPENFPF